MDEIVHGNEHRMAARGNATSCPLPSQYLLKQLQDGAAMEEFGRSVSLPRTGQELTHAVSTLSKTSAQYDSDVHMARFIHRAMVRRSVVVKLIGIMKKRGHRAYSHIDMNEVIAKASALPDHDAPPEIVRLLPL